MTGLAGDMGLRVFTTIGNLLEDSTELVLGASSLPVAMLIATYKLGTETLQPEEGGNVLTEWPGYFTLSLRVKTGFVFSLLAAIGSFVGVGLAHSGSLHMGGVLFVGSLLVAVVSLATTALARVKVREVLKNQ